MVSHYRTQTTRSQLFCMPTCLSFLLSLTAPVRSILRAMRMQQALIPTFSCKSDCHGPPSPHNIHLALVTGRVVLFSTGTPPWCVTSDLTADAQCPTRTSTAQALNAQVTETLGLE